MLRVSGQSVHSWPDVQCSNAPQLTWTLWPALPWAARTLAASRHWRIGARRSERPRCVSVASWFPPATRPGRECWKKPTTSHQSSWRPGDFTLWWCLGGIVSKFLHSFLYLGKKGGLCVVGQIFFNLCVNYQTFSDEGMRCGWLRHKEKNVSNFKLEGGKKLESVLKFY